MDISSLQNLKDEPLWQFERKLNELVRENSKYSNLDEKNRKLIMEVVKRHLEGIREGRGISAYAIQEESTRLWQNRIKLGLTEEDLKDIKEILGLFKK